MPSSWLYLNGDKETILIKALEAYNANCLQVNIFLGGIGVLRKSGLPRMKIKEHIEMCF